jgi:hypothetical protein
VNTFKKLAQLQVPDSPTTAYTVPLATQTLIRHIMVANPTGSDATFALWVDGTSNAEVEKPPSAVVAGGYIEFNGVMAMGAGDSIYVSSDTNEALTLTASGLEIT